MLKDTTALLLFDWDDYSYIGDTIIVESGAAIWKYIKDPNGNIIKQINRMKSNNQLAEFNYKNSGSLITRQLNTITYDETLITNYRVDNNNVFISSKLGGDKFLEEDIYKPNGLLKSKVHYKNGEKLSRTIVTYSYY